MTQRADSDRQILIHYLETEGTWAERIWLPLIRFVHKIELRKRNARG